jgi:hydroxymethylglutaryl-CoA lyase
MDMPRIETLEEAKHFIKGPAAYADAPSPWKGPIRSFMRPESLEEAPAEPTSDAAADNKVRALR